jgi:hypothetical protein
MAADPASAISAFSHRKHSGAVGKMLISTLREGCGSRGSWRTPGRLKKDFHRREENCFSSGGMGDRMFVRVMSILGISKRKLRKETLS